jgi:hypothetical protein
MKYETVLGCGHTLGFSHAPPFLGDEVWCLRCDAPATVTGAPYEWRAGCRSCTYASAPSTSKTEAANRARGHAGRYPSHRAAIFHGGGVFGVFAARDDALTRAFADLLERLGVEAPV